MDVGRVGGLVYQKASFDTHLRIVGFPCGELTERERRVDMGNNIPTEKWQVVCNGPVAPRQD